MNNKKNKNNRRIVMVTIVLVLFSVATLVTSRSATTIEKVFKDTIANIEYYVIKAPIQYVGGIFDEYSELKSIYDRDAKVMEKLDGVAREAALNEVLADELDELKELTEIDYLPTDYNIKYAQVLSRDAESWSDQITINKGSMSGIKEGMGVVSSKGMIGTVTNVTEISSTVSLLCSENAKSQLPVMILSGEDKFYGLLNRYDLETGKYKITLLSDADKIEKDATVVTSGLGGVGKSPKGILLGTVDSFELGSDSSESICTVTPSADFNNINYLAIVQRVNES